MDERLGQVSGMIGSQATLKIRSKPGSSMCPTDGADAQDCVDKGMMVNPKFCLFPGETLRLRVPSH
jgi:hypothetical protein